MDSKGGVSLRGVFVVNFDFVQSLYVSYTGYCLFKTEIWNPPVFYFFYVMQGQSGWGKFIWFNVLTSEIDNLCNIKGNPNSCLLFGKAYVGKHYFLIQEQITLT